MKELRCPRCHKLLARYEAQVAVIEVKCPRCKAVVRVMLGGGPDRDQEKR